MVLTFLLGDRAPLMIGAMLGGGFYSMDAQAGRPVVLLALGEGSPAAAKQTFERLRPAIRALSGEPIDILAMVPQTSSYAAAFADDADAQARVLLVAEAGGMERLTLNGAPAVIVLDRGGRIVALSPFEDGEGVVALYAKLAPQLRSAPGLRCAAAAPVLIIPNIAPLDFCRALIEHFEVSPHREGAMASYVDGAPVAKLDPSKKHRRDIELTAEFPLACGGGANFGPAHRPRNQASLSVRRHLRRPHLDRPL